MITKLSLLIISKWNYPQPGAQQKKFAWTIGVALSATMFIFMVIINSYSPITGITCLICLTFLFFESAFGICLGCKFYSLFHKEKVQYCPGEVCDIRSKQNILILTINLTCFGFETMHCWNGI